MHNIKLVIAYEGTNYLGWQKTPTGPSVEQALQLVLERILQQNIVLQAASRTDAGVHANGQVVNFFALKTHLDFVRLKKSLNSLLPPDIKVISIEKMVPSFHPTLDCQLKEYCYYICCGETQLPQHRFYSWHYPCSLFIEEMKIAASQLLGEHDFSAFCNSRKQIKYENSIRILKEIKIEDKEPKRLCISVTGNHFLYKMVRNIVGTLVHVGCGKIGKEKILSILNSADRTLAGVTAPAHGLFLNKILY